MIVMKPCKERYSDGDVPNVNFNRNNGKVYVNRYNPDDANDNLRSREKFRITSPFIGVSDFLDI